MRSKGSQSPYEILLLFDMTCKSIERDALSDVFSFGLCGALLFILHLHHTGPCALKTSGKDAEEERLDYH